ncbi:hypothetical protein WA577_007414, partial [Blastocystis sp. JDR]
MQSSQQQQSLQSSQLQSSLYTSQDRGAAARDPLSSSFHSSTSSANRKDSPGRWRSSANTVQLTALVEDKLVVSITPNAKPSKPGRRWTKEEDALLLEAVKQVPDHNWVEIAKHVPGRNNAQCMQRYEKVLRPGIKKGPWEPEEDRLLLELVGQLGDNWKEIALRIPGRSGAKCRERYTNYIGPDLVKGPWTKEEDNLILSLQQQWGNKWAAIAKTLIGRTANAVKNRFKSLEKKRENNPPICHMS